jgi:tetratricopeptide (TPR) repeat protein
MRHYRHALLVVALASTATAVPVLAQQPSDYPAPCEASKVSRTDVDRAHTVFLSGKQFLEESNYDKAISYFKDAYSIDCSVHAILPIIATAYERKGDRGEAVRALEEYVSRAPTAFDHDVIERRIKNLKDQLARDQAAASASSAPPVVSATPPPPPVAPTASAEPPPSAPASVAAPPPPPKEGAPKGAGIAPWVFVGIGGVAAAAGVVLYAIGSSDISSAQKLCPVRSACNNPGAVSQGNNGRGLENAGGPILGGGLGVAAAGLLWHFLDKPSVGASATAGATAGVSPAVAPGYAGVTLRESF